MTKLFTKKANKKSLTLFRPMIFSRHPSHNILRSQHRNISVLPYRSVIRFGSSTECDDTIAKGGKRIEINTVNAIKNSANKLLMKQKFTEAGIKTADWWILHNNGECTNGKTGNTTNGNNNHFEELFPIVAKAHYGSKGKGNTLIKSQEELTNWMVGKTLSNYIFEKFMNYALEYRLHVTEDGCFYACRKALKSDVPEDQKWRRHDDVCVWFLETNESFFKPNSWEEIEEHCVKALKAIGADILSFDVKVQSPTDKDGNKRDYQNYILLECNSASSMDNGTEEISVCAQKYISEIPKIIIKKARAYGK
jgi:glutathione synthase/RimK-type ligase-like ATP-grasp enzyme